MLAHWLKPLYGNSIYREVSALYSRSRVSFARFVARNLYHLISLFCTGREDMFCSAGVEVFLSDSSAMRFAMWRNGTKSYVTVNPSSDRKHFANTLHGTNAAFRYFYENSETAPRIIVPVALTADYGGYRSSLSSRPVVFLARQTQQTCRCDT